MRPLASNFHNGKEDKERISSENISSALDVF